MRTTLLLLLVAFLASIPFLGSSYLPTFFIILFMNLILASSYDIVGGYLGYVNLGHAVFFGLGAYTFGITWNAQAPLGVAFVCAVAAAVIFAALMAYPFFRLHGAYFSLGTFGLIRLFELLAFNFGSLTGGSGGLSVPSSYRLLPTFYTTLILALLTLAIVYKIAKSRLGLAFVSIREDEKVARDFGVPVLRYQTLALMLSASIAGLMGAVYTWYIIYINPEAVFGTEMALLPVAMAMLGGTGAIAGPVIGAVFISIVEEFLWTKLPYLHLAAYGLVIAGVGLFMPGGIVRVPFIEARLRWLGLVEDL
ncbi:MAG: branched-chain amino acid ABC transporter permease [Candidatus Tectomicrobia bacterium]|nr:branched-chain amino acid ABC transporter permease [Candidatus Tectomicrobia bacterium]